MGVVEDREVGEVAEEERANVKRRFPRDVCWTKASPFGYTEGVGYAVTKSATFLRWLKELRD